MAKRRNAKRLDRPARSVAKRSRIAVLGIGIAAVLTAGLLGYASITYFANRDWASAATVDGTAISRAELRDRIAVLAALQAMAVERATGADPGHSAAIEQAFGGDLLVTARAQLIDEVLLGREGTRRGLRLGPLDAATALARAINEPASRQVRWVDIVTTGRSAAEIQDASTTITERLRAGASVTDLEAAVETSWSALAKEAWLGAEGPETVTPDLPPPEVIVEARSVDAGTVLPPFDESGHRVLALVISVSAGTAAGPALREEAKAHGVSDSALDTWATGQALRQSLSEALLASWRANGGDQVQLAELALGPSAPGAPTVELSALALTRLDRAAPAERGQAIMAELGTLTVEQRAKRFADLVSQANAGAPPGPLERSGEIGWFGKDGLIAELGNAAFDPTRHDGDVLGPFQTAAGLELFLVEARYGGTLDERAAAVAVEARGSSNELATLASRVAPRDVGRATAGPWRSMDEIEQSARRLAELDTATIGEIVGPLDIEGTVTVARVLARRTGSFTARELAVLELTGLGHWLSDALSGAKIVLADDPLGLGSPSAAPSSDLPTTTERPPEPTTGNPPFGLPTPFLLTPPS